MYKSFYFQKVYNNYKIGGYKSIKKLIYVKFGNFKFILNYKSHKYLNR